MVSTGAISPIKYRPNIQFAGTTISTTQFLADFRSRTQVPVIKATLSLIRKGAVSHEHGLFFLTELRKTVAGHARHHSNNDVRTLAGAASTALNRELALATQELSVAVTGRDQLNLAALRQTAREELDPALKEATRAALRTLASRNIIDLSEVSDVLDDRADQHRIDALLTEAVPHSATIRSYKETQAKQKELAACGERKPDYKNAEVRAKVTELESWLKLAKPTLHEEALVEEPLKVDNPGAAGSSSFYQIVDVLGEGGMARVFLAEKIGEPGKRYAIKVLTEGFLDQESIFIEEGNTIAGLNHPNIVKGYGVGHLTIPNKRSRPFIVMERMQTALDKTIPGTAEYVLDKLTDEQRLEVAQKVAEALHFAWSSNNEKGEQRKLLHRDIKPGNILIEFNAQGRLIKVKLADFGLAKALGEVKPDTEHTATGTVKGTIKYIAPEAYAIAYMEHESRIAKLATAGLPIDIYAWGLTVYKILAKTYPPERQCKDQPSLESFIRAKGAELARYTLKKPAAIPDALWPIILKATEMDPANRYQNWLEVLKALHEAMPDPTMEKSISFSISVALGEFSQMGIVADEDASRLARLIPERDYPATPEGKGKAYEDLAAVRKIVTTLESIDPNDQHLPELRLNAVAIELWLRLANGTAPDPREMAKLNSIVSAAEQAPAAARSAAFADRLEYTRTTLAHFSGPTPDAGTAELLARLERIQSRQEDPDLLQITELAQELQAIVDELEAKLTLSGEQEKALEAIVAFAPFLQMLSIQKEAE